MKIFTYFLIGLLLFCFANTKRLEEELFTDEEEDSEQDPDAQANTGDYELPKLAYGLADLEPVISQQTMNLHYNKHHQTYITNLNAAMKQLNDAIPKKDLPTILALQLTIIFNGGGDLNHNLYWENLSPIKAVGGKLPAENSPLTKKVIEEWGSFDKLIQYFTDRSNAIKGSGWGWLVLNKSTNKLEFVETHDHGTISQLPDMVPLLVVDVWEHAYYLDYKNVRKDYLTNIWKIINWGVVETRYSLTQ